MAISTGSLSNLEKNQMSNLSGELLTAVLSRAQELITGDGGLDSIEVLLKEIGVITQVSRVWIFQTLELNDDYILQDYVFEWASEDKYIQIGLPRFNHFKSNINTAEYATLIESRKKGEYQNLITENLPDSWLKSYLKSQKILSMLTIPIIVENEWWGTLGLDDCERAFEWSLTEISLLKTTSFFISNVIIRDKLFAREKQLRLLKQNTICSTWEFDLRRGHLWSTSEVFAPNIDVPYTIHFVSRNWLRRIHPEFRSLFFRKAKRFLTQKDTDFRCVVKMRVNNDLYRWIEISASDEDLTSGTGDVLVGVFRDVTKRKENEIRLELEAITDPLTGLFNRRKMEEEISHSLLDLAQKNRIFSLVIIDLDFFKNINDTYGHLVGDKVLCHFSQLCQQSLRSSDCISRFGGEEFALVLRDTCETEAVATCNRIRKLLKSSPYRHENTAIEFTVSIGCTTVRDETLKLEKVFELADVALYQAKQSGRNQVVLI